jgi:predicted O-methyltransferase YrrM
MFQSYGVWYPKKEKPLKGLELFISTEVFQPTDFIRNIFKTGKVKTESGKVKYLKDAIDPYEGYFIYKTIIENDYKDILEIGMANGMSGLYICSALQELGNSKECHLTSIDPFQSTQWENTGIQTLRDADLLKYHKLIEELDYLAMPKLVEEEKLYDLIFIDGNHLFDYTLLDLHFANKLLKVGGMIVVDDTKHENVKMACKFFEANYQNFGKIKNGINMETQNSYVKFAEDVRPWFFHIDF